MQDPLPGNAQRPQHHIRKAQPEPSEGGGSLGTWREGGGGSVRFRSKCLGTRPTCEGSLLDTKLMAFALASDEEMGDALALVAEIFDAPHVKTKLQGQIPPASPMRHGNSLGEARSLPNAVLEPLPSNI